MATSGAILREARLRAGLTQAELAVRSGKDRTQIARWEREAVQPSYETLVELVRACGFDLPVDLVPYAQEPAAVLEELARLTPHQRLVRSREVYPDPSGDPVAVLAALERGRVTYVVIGSLARVLNGTDEPIAGVDLTPHGGEDNLARLATALGTIDATPADATSRLAAATLKAASVSRFATTAGAVTVVPVPDGTRGGWDDLRWHAQREALGGGVRAPIASAEDCARMLATLGGDEDTPRLNQLRQLIELERSLGLEL